MVPKRQLGQGLAAIQPRSVITCIFFALSASRYGLVLAYPSNTSL